jgi:hypothetical protein
VDPREAARTLSLGRVALGAWLFATPRLGTEGWIGRRAREPGVKVIARGLGARDVGIGAATLATLASGRPLRPLLAAALLADTTDLVTTLLTRDHLPRFAAPLLVAAAGSGIALGAVALAGADDDGGAPVPA